MMKVRLLACLEKFVTSVKSDMDICVQFNDVCQGVRYFRSHEDHICPGYDRRKYKDEHELSSMLLWSAAQFVLWRESVIHHLKLFKAPSSAQMQEVVDVLNEYENGGGHIGFPESDPVHLCGPQYSKTLWSSAV